MKRPELLPDWRRIMRRAWSFKLALLSALLSAIEVGIYFIAATRPSPLMAMLAALTSLAAALSRIVSQPKAFQR